MADALLDLLLLVGRYVGYGVLLMGLLVVAASLGELIGSLIAEVRRGR